MECKRIHTTSCRTSSDISCVSYDYYDLFLLKMATSSSQNKAAAIGYECRFLDQVPEEYLCRQCKHVAREPIIVDCCNETMCEACVQEMMEDKKPCSNCQKVPVKYIPNKIKNKILDLNVHCLNCQKVPVKFIPQNKIRSCKWTGQLQQLDEHLSDCEYVDTKCQQCKKSVQKRNMITHLANECPERELVTEVHFENYQLYILKCPNGCGVHFERGDLEDHINMCSLQKVECKFNFAGCEAEFIRGQPKDHMEQNTQKHLALIATTLRISQEQQQAFDQKLQEQTQMTNKFKKQQITSTTRSLWSVYILLISLSVLIITWAICYEQEENSNCDNIFQTLKKDTEKSIEAMKSKTEKDINALKMETDKRMEVMKIKTENEMTKKINAMQREHEKKIHALIDIQNKKINVKKQKTKHDNEREKTEFADWFMDWIVYLIKIRSPPSYF